MGFTVSYQAGGGKFEMPPAGSYIGRCVRILDLGTQPGEWNGKPRDRRKVAFYWELPDDLIENGPATGQPFLLSKWYTLSLSETATLRTDLMTWRGRDFTQEELDKFEMTTVLGAVAMLGVTISDKGRAQVTTVSKVPKQLEGKIGPQVNPLVFLSLQPQEFSWETYEGISEGMRKFIDASPEFKLLKDARDYRRVVESDDLIENDPNDVDDSDDLPFSTSVLI
jgi:hypothetical protein